MTDLLNLDVRDDCVVTTGGPLFFFRIQPPNLAIMDNTSLEALYQGFEALMRGTDTIPFALYAADQPVSLEKNREFIRTLSEPLEGMRSALIEAIAAAQGRTNTERAYYLIVGEKKNKPGEWKNTVASLLVQHGIAACPVDKDELVSMLRGWLLREHVDDQIYMGVEE